MESSDAKAAPALIAISYATNDLKMVGPIVEMLLLQLADPLRELLFFFPYADATTPETQTLHPKHLQHIYEDATLVVVFHSKAYENSATGQIPREVEHIESRLEKGRPCQFLALDDTAYAARNTFREPSFERCEKLTRPQIAKKIFQKVRSLDAAFDPRPLVELRNIWTPVFSPRDSDVGANHICDSLAMSTAVSCQTVWWTQLLERAHNLNKAISMLQEVKPTLEVGHGDRAIPEAHLANLADVTDAFFLLVGGLGLSKTRVMQGPSPLGFENTLSHNRSAEEEEEHVRWRAIARIELLLHKHRTSARIAPGYVDFTLAEMASWLDVGAQREAWLEDEAKLLSRLRGPAKFLQDIRIATGLNLIDMNDRCSVVPRRDNCNEPECLEHFLTPLRTDLIDFAVWT